MLAGAAALCAALAACDDTPPDGAPIRVLATFGGLGNTPGHLAYPRAIVNDGSTLWVIDRSARLQRFDPLTGDCIDLWMMPDYEMGMPVGITVAPGPRGEPAIYVADTHYHRVLIYGIPDRRRGRTEHEMPPPELLASFGSYGFDEGQFVYPTDVAVLTADDGRTVERIYVSEYGGGDRVSVYDADHNYLFSFGTYGVGRDKQAVEFNRPQALLLDADRRELLVADSRNHRLGRFTLDGELISWIGSPETAGGAPGRFRFPFGLAPLPDGTVMVAEYGNNRVQRIDPVTGESLGMWGVAGRGTGELAYPWSVTVMGDRTFVLDTGNNRIVAFATPRGRR